jgi:hypothetical protein
MHATTHTEHNAYFETPCRRLCNECVMQYTCIRRHSYCASFRAQSEDPRCRNRLLYLNWCVRQDDQRRKYNRLLKRNFVHDIYEFLMAPTLTAG